MKMEKTKVLQIFRHSLKDGDFISPEGYELIKNFFEVTYLVTKQFFSSPYTRAIQTAAALMEKRRVKMANFSIVTELACLDVEKEMLSNENFMSYWKGNPKAEIYEILDAVYTAEEILDIEESCFKMVQSIFGKMTEDKQAVTTAAIATSHNPYISLAANYLLNKRKYGNMKELGSITFEMDSRGKISVIGDQDVSILNKD